MRDCYNQFPEAFLGDKSQFESPCQNPPEFHCFGIPGGVPIDGPQTSSLERPWCSEAIGKTCWCSVGNVGMHPGVPLRETRDGVWGHSISQGSRRSGWVEVSPASSTEEARNQRLAAQAAAATRAARFWAGGVAELRRGSLEGTFLPMVKL